MVATGCTIGTYMPSPQDSAQTLPYPTVEWLEDGVLAVLEVFKPAGRAAIEFPDDVSHASGSAALGLFSYGCFELFQALLARPAIASFEVVAQKVETAFWRASTMRVLVGCSVSPAACVHWRSCSITSWASGSVWHRMTKSSA